MNEDIFFIGSFFLTAIVLAFGIPLTRAYIRRKDAELRQTPPVGDARLARMEAAIESMAVEIERISEGQRFVTKLLAERDGAPRQNARLEPGAKE